MERPNPLFNNILTGVFFLECAAIVQHLFKTDLEKNESSLQFLLMAAALFVALIVAVKFCARVVARWLSWQFLQKFGDPLKSRKTMS